jgi:predicted TIM-barrel enzyme
VVKDIAADTAVVVNTGVNADNVREQLSIADAAIVGTFFKKDGKFENAVDPERVRRLMTEVEALRNELAR